MTDECYVAPAFRMDVMAAGDSFYIIQEVVRQEWSRVPNEVTVHIIRHIRHTRS